MREPAFYWIVIAGMGVITFALRLSMIALLGRWAIPEGISRALRFVPPAVFSALVAPALLRPAGPVDISFANSYLLAGLLAAVVAWRWRSIFLTIGAGMISLWLL
ncbi:MAG: AzlD domain-containing protein, partial [bacterium]